MDSKRSSKPRGKPIIDELALAKSAAWAWYQHGSRPDGSGSIREFDVWRTKIEPKPSRYKLEALKKVQVVSNSPRASIVLSSSRPSSSRVSNSLFDNYEIERISKQLDFYIESTRAKKKNKVVKKNKSNWLKLRAPVCGSSTDDVVEINKSSFDYSRPEKGRRVAVVEVVSCRPRRIRA